MISISKKENIFRLDTPNTSYVLGVEDGRYLCHMYYGAAVSDDDLLYLLRTQEAPWTPAVNPGEKLGFYGRCHFEYPCFGTGDFREACLNVRNAQGQSGAELFYQTYALYEGKKPLPGLPSSFGSGCQTLEIKLSDPVLDLEAVLSYTVFDDVDVITRSVSVTNRSEHPLFLTRVLSACLDMDNTAATRSGTEAERAGECGGFRALTFGGAWAREHIIQTQEIACSGITAESMKGEPGHETQPFIAAVSRDCGQDSGEVCAMHFVYSGNFIAKIQKDAFDSLRMVIGIHPETFEWKLEPGETFQAPEAVLVYSARGLGGMTRTLHDFYRAHLIRSPWQYRERPVLINNWEATYFDFDIHRLLELAGEAQKCGIEMLVCDDGWFGEQRDSPEGGLGDWFVNEKKLEGGFGALRESLRKKGMRFGLWFEPEMIAPQSRLFREHPDWVLRMHEREPGLCRGQWVLDFSNPEVLDYLFTQMSSVIRENAVDYVKWDMNRPLCDAGSSYLPADRQGELWHRHVLGLYELQERLLQAFPELLLENCSSGGARFDPGMLYYSPQIWCSDDMDPIERLSIQEGTELLYPLSTIGAHVCREVNDITGRSVPFETRALTALTGTFGYELDITQLSAEEKEAIPGQIRRYKSVRRLIQEGDYYRLASWRLQHDLDITEVLSKDRAEGFLLLVQPLGVPNAASRRICLRGLDPQALYEVSGEGILGNIGHSAGAEGERHGDTDFQTLCEVSGEGIPGNNGHFAEAGTDPASCETGGTVRLHGDTLMHAGYMMKRPKGDFRAVFHRIKKV